MTLPISDAARAFVRHMARVAEQNIGADAPDVLFQMSLEEAIVFYRLGALPTLSEEDEVAIKDRLERVFVDREVTERDIVRELRMIADGG